jgi:hypothetical protein
MVLRETLVDADIPKRDKMGEVIMSHWRASFENLKEDLSVA